MPGFARLRARTARAARRRGGLVHPRPNSWGSGCTRDSYCVAGSGAVRAAAAPLTAGPEGSREQSHVNQVITGFAAHRSAHLPHTFSGGRAAGAADRTPTTQRRRCLPHFRPPWGTPPHVQAPQCAQQRGRAIPASKTCASTSAVRVKRVADAFGRCRSPAARPPNPGESGWGRARKGGACRPGQCRRPPLRRWMAPVDRWEYSRRAASPRQGRSSAGRDGAAAPLPRRPLPPRVADPEHSTAKG